MNRKTYNILNNIVNDHKKKRTSTSARKCEENNILSDIINDHKKKRTSTSTRQCEESDHDMIDVLLKLQETSELELNITNNHIKEVTL
ncbi:hypothetical protein CFP56_038316, partial [Quercus suber]